MAVAHGARVAAGPAADVEDGARRRRLVQVLVDEGDEDVVGALDVRVRSARERDAASRKEELEAFLASPAAPAAREAVS